MSNPEIEYFKRFAVCYLKWSHSNFDRIVSDAVKRQERVKAEEDEAKRINAIGSTLKIRFPTYYKKPVPVSFWKKLLTGTRKLFRS